MIASIDKYLNKTTKAAPLAVFRILFGMLMSFSIIRFWYHGWIEKLYLEPKFHFHYLGFEWIQVPGRWVYLLFFICGVSALLFALGFKYRLSIITFFLSFTYIELMDKTTYLNHYYFVSVVSLILIFLPANMWFSIDATRDKNLRSANIPRWCIDSVMLFVALVYFYAGLAKLNSDWMLNALPLGIWLPIKSNIPIIGPLLDEKWLHYLFSWGGAIYDLTIVFFLMWRRTRLFAFAAVVFFHLITRILFPIGMFPYIMIISTLLFFDASIHEYVLKKIDRFIGKSFYHNENKTSIVNKSDFTSKLAPIMVAVVLIIQIVLPWRFTLYPGNLFWTEQGYRFSWRVMLMEKTAYANFKIVDGETGKRFYVQNEDFLTPFQQKQMSTQADFIVEYAHYLGKHFEDQGHQNVEVYVESVASLNGRPSQEYIRSDVDLLKIKNSLKHKDIFVPIND